MSELTAKTIWLSGWDIRYLVPFWPEAPDNEKQITSQALQKVKKGTAEEKVFIRLLKN